MNHDVPYRLQCRRGYSLVELLTVIATLAILLTVGVGAIQFLLRIDRAGKSALVNLQRTRLLAEQFQTDVHAAQTGVLTKDGKGLDLSIGSHRTVTYRSDDQGRLTREAKENGQPKGREAVELSSPARFEFLMEDNVVVLRVSPADPNALPETRLRGTRIEAILSHDERFVSKKGASSDATSSKP